MSSSFHSANQYYMIKINYTNLKSLKSQDSSTPLHNKKAEIQSQCMRLNQQAKENNIITGQLIKNLPNIRELELMPLK